VSPVLREELRLCQAALERCRRLGASLEQFTTLTLEGAGRAGAYTRAGGAEIMAPTGILHTRV
jgi:hypothetical protein